MSKFEDIDISELIKKQPTKNQAKNVKISKKGLFDMAENPMIAMALNNMPGKYKAMIFFAFVFIIVGAISSVYWVAEVFAYHPSESLIGSAAIIFLYVVRRIYKNIKGKSNSKKK